MLRKIISIKNVGRFRNSISNPNPTWARYTFGFGANGYGKTTLCAILRSIQNGDAANVIGRKSLSAGDQPTIELLFTSGARKYGAAGWDQAEPNISIFDSVFVAENVHSGDAVEVGHKRSLYRVIVGSAGVGLADREQALAEASRTTQAVLTAAEKVVAAHAGSMALKTFIALQADPDIDAKISAQAEQVRGQREAESIRTRAVLAPLTVPSVEPGIYAVLDVTFDGVGADAEERLRQHLVDHQMLEGGQRWVAEGVQYDTGDDCPFCGRDGAAALPLVQAFRALFSEAYAALQTTITNARENMNGAIGEGPRGRISTGAAENISHVEYWERQCSIDRTALPSLDAVLRDMTSADASLQRLLSAKAAAPLQAVNDGPALDEARGLIAEAAATVTTYNSAVVAANVAIAAKKTLTASGDLAQSESALAGLEASKRRHRPDVAKACGEYERLEAAKKKIDDEKKTVRAELEKHSKLVVRPYEGRINYFLGRFNAEFKISNTGHGYPGGIATATYDLTIDNTLVELGDSKTPLDKASFRNTLSAGDRTTLALAFFLAHLEREPDLAERIVVFDDPFNSQDSFRRKQTIFEILAQAAKAAQLIVLSHDPLFLKNLWEKCPPAERAAVQLLYHPTTGSKICAFDLDDACKGRAAAELDDLLAYRASGAGNPREIIKKLRIVLETHYRSAFPGSFGTTDNCAAILKKIRDGGDNHPAKDHHDDLNRINDYTADYHHGEDASGTAEPVLDATELLGFVEDTLRMVNALPA